MPRESFLILCRCSDGELDKFIKENTLFSFADVTVNHESVTVINRRMFREEKEREQARLRQHRHRLSRESNGEVTTPSSSSSSSSTPKRYVEGEDPFDLATYLWEYIQENNEKAKPPDLQKWAASIDRLLRIDKRYPGEVAAIISWAQHDDFWMANILSPDKLRKQYDRLYLEAKKAGAELRLEKQDG